MDNIQAFILAGTASNEMARCRRAYSHRSTNEKDNSIKEIWLLGEVSEFYRNDAWLFSINPAQ